MQLVCPSCASEYQVSAEAIGAKGRMVRCAACNSEWFQTPEERKQADAAPETVVPPAPEASEPPAPEPTVKRIKASGPQFRTEPSAQSQRDDTSRRMSALSGLGDNEDDFKSSYPKPSAQDPDDFSDLRADAPPVNDIYYDVDPEPQTAPESPVVEMPPVRNNRSAELDELTSSLRSDDDVDSTKTGGAFLAGFASVTLLALILIAIYVKAPDIAELAPAAKGPLSAYASMVDQGRMSIAQLVTGG